MYRLSAFIILGEMLATPASAALMTISPWIPYLLGLAIVAIGLPIAYFLPETLDRSSSASETDTEHNEISIVDQLWHQARQFVRLTRFLRTGNILMALFMFLTTSLSRQSASLLLQYSSARYDWSLAHASLFLSLRGVVNLLTFAVLMPAVSSLLVNGLRLSSTLTDRRMSQASGTLSIIGFAFIAMDATPGLYIVGLVLFSLGSAFVVSTRSLATALVRPEQIGRLYSAAAVVQSIGTLVAGPLFSKLFHIGLETSWLGLPFLLAAGLFALATLAASSVKAVEPESGPESEPLLGHDA